MKRFFAAILLALSFVTVSLAQDSANLFRPTATPPSPPCPYSRLFMNTSNQMALVSCTGVVTVIGSGGGGSGTVTSVALALPSIFSVSGSPVTASGTLTATLATQTANTGLMGPTSGGAAAPTFRALVSADIPSLDAAKITSGIIATARLGSGTANSTTFLRGDQTWAVPSFTVTGVPDAINAVRDFGCVGDDVADDTTCLTNALAATALTTGKALYLRTGTYKTTAKLAVPGGVTLYGDGREKTIIHGTANDTILELKAGTGLFLFEGPTIRNLSVYGSSSGANQIGVSVDDAVGPDFYINGAWIENISVYQTGSHGVYFGRAFSSTFKRIYASAPVSGYPFLFDQFNMPGNTFEGLYAQDVNATNPAGFRVRTGDIHCWGCNGINNSSSNSWWAIIGDKVGVDGAASNISAYFNCWGCNIESSKAGGIWHYSDSTSYLDGRTLFSGDASGSGTYVALKYEVTTPGSGGLPAAQPKGKLGPLVVFANSPLSFYANSEVIHANDLPPVTVEGDIRQADGAIISSYRNTTNSRSEKIFRLDARMPVTTITASANFTQPAATNYEANCASGCTLTLPFAGYWASMEQLVYIRNIGIGTLVVNGNSGSSINGGGSYSLASGESVTFIPHSASADYRLVGVGGSGVANRITYWNDVQRVTSSANLTYDGTTVLNQRAGGNPYFAANDTTNGITTRFGPLAGAPDRAIIGTTSNHPFGLYANNAERWTVGVAGHFTPGAANTTDVGSTSLPARSGYFGTSVVLGIGSSVTGQTVFNNSTNSNTTTLKSGAPASSIEITLPATLPASAGCLQISSSGVITQTGSACGSGGGGSTAWSAITDPSAGLTLSMGGHVTAFNWGNATSTANMFTVADTGGNTGTGYVLSLNTASGSAAKPVRITADGVVNGVEMTTAGSLQAMGTGGIVATIGDSATSFFTAGQIEAARGGTGIDSSGSTGVVRVNAGTWSANAGVSHLASSSSADLRGVLNDETGSGAAVFAGGNIGAATATTLNGLTISATTGTLTIANGKTLTFNNTVALSGTDGTTMTFPATTTTVAGLGIAQTFTALQTINPGTTPTTAALIDINSLGTAGTRDSNWLVFRGRSNDGSTHLSEWKQYVDVTANAGTSQLVFESRIDAASFTSRFTIGDDSAVSGGAFSGDSFTASGGSILDDDVNAATGFTIAGAAASGQFLRGNGTRAVFSTIQSSDLPGSFNGFANPTGTIGLTAVNGSAATAMRSDAAPALSQSITPTWTASHTFAATMTAREIDPQTDNTYDLGTTSLRWKTVHVGPGSLIVHNDTTNTLKATLGFSGSTAQLITDSSTPLQLRTGANNGIFLNTNGSVGFNLATTTNGNFDFRQIANGDQILNLRRATDTSPTGNFINFENAVGTDLFTVDINGSLTAGGVPTARLTGTLAATNFPALTGDVTTTAGAVATTIANDVVTDAKLRNSAALSVIGRSANSTGDPADIAAANDGEVLRRSGTALSFGTVAAAGIANNAVSNAKLAQVATATFKGRTTAGTGDVEDLTATQATALLDAFTSSAKGLAPPSGGGTTNFLRADGAWAAPSGGGAVSSVSNSDTTLTISPTTGAVVASLNLGKANTWTALTTLNPGTTPTNALLLDIVSLGTAGTRNSHDITWRGRSNDGSAHSVEWRSFVSVTGNTGASKWALFSRIDSGTSTERFAVDDAGDVVAGNFSGTNFADDGGSVLDDDVNAATGFTVAGAAASGQYLRGNGTRGVFSAILSGDLPSTVVRTDQANTYSTGAQSFASATSFTVPIAAGAAPTGSGTIAYDSTAGELEYGDSGVNRIIANLNEAQTFTNKSISGSTNTLSGIGNSSLVNSAITITGISTSLGGSITLDSMTGLSSNGLVARTAANTFVVRTLAAGSASLTVTNGDGVSGNPTINTVQNIQTTATPQFARMGLGAAAGSTALLTIAGGTVTADSPVFDLTQTWNSGAVTFNGIKLNVTNTASAVGSKLLDLQVGGSSQFAVDRNGTVTTTTVNASSFMSIGGSTVPTVDSTNTFTNKTISGSSNTLTNVAATSLAGLNSLTTATPASDDSLPMYDTSASANRRATIAEIVATVTEGYIQGAVLSYSSTTQVQVSTGTVHIQSSGSLMRITSAISISPSLSANTWYHCYVYSNSGTPAGECVTTAPASPYSGTARSKTSDTTRRYIGSIRTNGSSEIQNFYISSAGAKADYLWRLDVATLRRALGGGTASTKTTVSLSSLSGTGGSGSTASAVPNVSGLVGVAIVRIVNLCTNGSVLFADTSDATGTSSAGTGIVGILQDADIITPIPINSSQEIRYAFTVAITGPGAYIDALGFQLLR